MPSDAQEFEKYDLQGPYHWRQMQPSLKRFNAGLAARYHHALALVKSCCQPEKIASIIDIGCGDGYFTNELAKLFPNASVTGYDFSKTGIKLATEHCTCKNISIRLGDAFAGETTNVSLITAADVIEHIDDYRLFLRRCNAALKTNGWLLLSTPIRIKEIPDDKYHVHEFFPSELATEVINAGFRIRAQAKSHDYRILENYGRRFSLLGIGRMRLGKYITNFRAIVLKKNPFAAANTDLPTMQYILAEKSVELSS